MSDTLSFSYQLIMLIRGHFHHLDSLICEESPLEIKLIVGVSSIINHHFIV